MKLTILVDNNTFIDQYYHGEPAASFYIESGNKHILFDTGYSDILLSNADKMNIDLEKITHIILSHGHDDHTKGLKYLQERIDLANKKIISHSKCFLPKYNGALYIGAPFTSGEIEKMAEYQPCDEAFEITENLFFLGQIPRKNNFENQKPIGKYCINGILEDDYMLDDTALAYKGKNGLFIITGCSHSGICNIIEHAKHICKEDKIYGVLGGFHLFKDDLQLEKTISYLRVNEIKAFYPCHCVSLLARAKMMQALPVVETGVGLTIEIE